MYVKIPEKAPETSSTDCILSHSRHASTGCGVLGTSTSSYVKQAWKAAVPSSLKEEGFSPEELGSCFTVSGGWSLMLAKDLNAVFS